MLSAIFSVKNFTQSAPLIVTGASVLWNSWAIIAWKDMTYGYDRLGKDNPFLAGLDPSNTLYIAQSLTVPSKVIFLALRTFLVGTCYAAMSHYLNPRSTSILQSLYPHHSISRIQMSATGIDLMAGWFLSLVVTNKMADKLIVPFCYSFINPLSPK